MEFKGTKGEWFLSETQNLRPTHIAIKNNQNSRLICLISEPKNMDIEDEANAKLIENAPKLLEALYELISLKKWKDEFGKDEWYLEKQPLAWGNAQKVLEKTLT
jgi:hypothetical protein